MTFSNLLPNAIFFFRIYILIGKASHRKGKCLCSQPVTAMAGWNQVPPGTWNSIRIAHVGGKGPISGALFCCFPRFTSKAVRSLASWGMLVWQVLLPHDAGLPKLVVKTLYDSLTLSLITETQQQNGRHWKLLPKTSETPKYWDATRIHQASL